jgi:hypothetical protein
MARLMPAGWQITLVDAEAEVVGEAVRYRALRADPTSALALTLRRARVGEMRALVAVLRGKLRAVGFSFFVPVAFIAAGEQLDLSVLARPDPLSLSIAMTMASGLTRLLAMPLLRLQAEWDKAVLVAIVRSQSLTRKLTVVTPAVAATTTGDVTYPVLFRWLMQRRAAAAAPRAGVASPPAAFTN